MDSRKSRSILRVLCCCAAMFLLAFPVLAQEDNDTNPNSPTPILLSEESSNRALAIEPNAFRRKNLAKVESRAFLPDTEIVLFVTNLELMKDEGANALRVYVEDKLGRKYRFPVLDLQPVKGQEWIYSVTVKLKDEIGFWEQPVPDGDLNIYLTWRGLASNTVKLGFGKMGGNIKDAEATTPTPYKQFATKPAVKKDVETSDYVGYRFTGDRLRLQEQAAFGPSTMLDSRIRRIGLRTWLTDQFTAPYPTNPYPNFPLRNSNSADVTNGCGMFTTQPDRRICERDHYSQYPLQTWFFKEAFYGDQQLRHRIAWTLSQIWVTSGVDVQQSSHMIAYHKVLSDNAFGNYRDLMKAMSLNPAMGDYLDMVRSTRNNPNENYPREILQLFTIGLYMLNQDGTLMLDNGNPIPTYSQDTVNNFTEVFTGWTYCNTPATCPNAASGTNNFKDPMLLNQNNHNVTTKTLLSYPNAVNQNIAANLNGNVEIDLALDNIFNHPNVAPFVSKLFIQHLVTSDPTPAYVGRIASVFRNNGSGVRGDMKAVIKAILLDVEARGDVKTDPNFGKLREPVQLMTNLFRAFNVRSVDGLQQSDGFVYNFSTNMAQNVFRAPTVFNYYTPDYVVPGTAMPGPEFGIMTTGTAIARANFVNSAIMNATIVAVSENSLQGTTIDLTEMQNLAAADTTSNQLLDALNQKMLHGTMSTQMKNIILPAVNAVPANTPLQRARQAIYLVATSSQYQVQR